MNVELTAGDIIKHYKGGVYRVLFLSKHTETEEELVSYQEYKNREGVIWTRPLKMLYEQVEINGETVPRFEFVNWKQLKIIGI